MTESLQHKQGMPIQEGEQFDVRVIVDTFRHPVKMYTLWKLCMEINVSHIQ
jgi:poly(A) polymerase